MTDDTDIQGMFKEAFQEALGIVKSTAKTMTDDVDRPADPNAVRLTPAERDAEFTALMSDPAAFSSAYGQAAARYNLPKDKPIPRRFVQRIIEGNKRGS